MVSDQVKLKSACLTTDFLENVSLNIAQLFMKEMVIIYFTLLKFQVILNSQVHNFQKLKNISRKAVNFFSNKNKSNLFE